MTLDTARELQAASTVGTVFPPTVELGGGLNTFDMAQVGWSFKILGTEAGTIVFFNTVMGSGVDASTSYTGVMIDESGNLRVSGQVSEGP